MRTNTSGVSEYFFRSRRDAFAGRLFSVPVGNRRRTSCGRQLRFWKRFARGPSETEGTTLSFAGRSFAVVVCPAAGRGFSTGDRHRSPGQSFFHRIHRAPDTNCRAMVRLRDGVSPRTARVRSLLPSGTVETRTRPHTDAVSFGMTPLRERM